MEIIKSIDKNEKNRVTLSVIGTVDTETASELNAELMALDYDGLDLTLDFGKTRYITSAGLRALLVARKKLSNDTMRVIRVNEAVAEVFSMTGFDSLIRIETEKETEDRIGAEQYRLGFSALLRERLKTDRKKTAFIYCGRSYTWEDVDKTSQLMADDLARLGVRKGSHVGICSPNSFYWAAAFFAIQKLGGIAVLINPALRPGEVMGVAGIGDASVVCYGEIAGVTSFEAYAASCLTDGSCIKHMYDISDRIDFAGRYAEYDAIRDKYTESFPADDASVIIFSSGSTGFPKAILSSSYSVMINIEPLIKEMRVTESDVNLAFLPMFHIFGFSTGVSAGLLTGYVSVIPENKSPDTMIRLIEQYRCTMFNTVPTMMLAIIKSPAFASEKLSSLRISILGGSATTESQMRMLRQLLPNVHFGNIYGMSENAAISLTLYEDTVEHMTQTVGKPVSGLELCIRDTVTGKALPNGSEGEICIRSKAMVICYYRLDIDKQPVDDDGWLATGDLGVIDGDGYLRIVGRKKDLIICGGENISPGEIAEAAARLPGVADVKVLGVPDEIYGEVVAAAVILKDGATWDEGAARAELSKHLAKYKLPVYYVIVDRFPLLGSGKVDAITLKKQIAASVGKR